jgi:hypothetical protein
MRLCAFCVCLLLIAGALNARSIGIEVNGTCEAGTCPATALAFSSNDALLFDFTLTLPNGDMYLIDGLFTDSNNDDGSAVADNQLFQVTYEGNSAGGASDADTVTVQEDNAFQTTLASGGFNSDLFGAFGPTIAASSSSSLCVNGTLGCLGPVTPPESFDLTADFPMNSASDVFVYDPAFTSNFGAGSPVGSYIVYGQTEALPEPASFGLLALGLGGIFTARRTRHLRAA